MAVLTCRLMFQRCCCREGSAACGRRRGSCGRRGSEASGQRTPALRRSSWLLLGGLCLALPPVARACTDFPDWTDRDGYGCQFYSVQQWCMGADYGPRWESSYGAFEDFAGVGGLGAGDACCNCGRLDPDAGGAGGIALDSGGDGCEYYEQFPGHCGCCDTSGFRAERDCNATCVDLASYDTDTVMEVIAAWPAKATRLHCENVRLRGDLRSLLPWANLTNLTRLQLIGAGLTGGLPEELASLSNLMYLHLGGNALSGGLPPALGELRALLELGLQRNRLTGGLPSELQHLTSLESLDLSFNQLTGTLPSWLGSLGDLRRLHLQSNQFSGRLPLALGELKQLGDLRLQSNRLSGSLPPALGGLGELQRLELSENGLSGEIPSELGQLAKLKHLKLQSNALSGAIPGSLLKLKSLQQLVLARNKLSGSIPSTFSMTDGSLFVDLSENELTGSISEEIKEYGLIYHLSLHSNRLSGIIPSVVGELEWLQHLDLSNNSFTGDIPQELSKLYKLYTLRLDSNRLTGGIPAGLGQLSRLVELRLHSNGLRGPLPGELWALPSLMTLSLHSNQLEGEVDIPQGTAPALKDLLLSRNRLTGLGGAPPAKLVNADVSENRLLEVADAWFRFDGILDLRANPLRLPVRPSSDDPADQCPPGPADALVADPLAWSAVGGLAECTRLCDLQGLLRHALSINESALCRCTGGSGSGRTCARCPEDHYSEASFEAGGWRRRCRPCPAFATRTGPEDAGIGSCQCSAGRYLDIAAGDDGGGAACRRCPQWPYRTVSSQGASSESLCECNARGGGFLGLVARATRWGEHCGCPAGEFMDNVRRRCTPCSAFEVCNWVGGDGAVQKSVDPPRIIAGYWAEGPWAMAEQEATAHSSSPWQQTSNPPAKPAPLEAAAAAVAAVAKPKPLEVDYSAYQSFAGHTIWRCASASTCRGGSTCEGHRHGRACALCEPGYFGGVDGPCRPCPGTPSEARRSLWVAAVAAMVVPLLVNRLLQANVDSDKTGFVALLRSLRTWRAILRFCQVMAITSGFSVRWPPVVQPFFQVMESISLDLVSWTGPSCLIGWSSMTTEVVAQWLLPGIAVLVTFAAAALVTAGSAFYRRSRMSCPRCSKRLAMAMGVWDSLRVLVFLLGIFFPALLSSTLTVFTCMPTLDGHWESYGWTVKDFPHVRCGQPEDNWRVLAAVSGVLALALCVAFPAVVYAAWLRECAARLRGGHGNRGWWSFFFDDFRLVHMDFPLTIIYKDIAINVVACAGAGYGAVQLIATAGISLAFSYRCVRRLPYYDMSINVLEIWNGISLAILCTLTAGMGFQSEPGVGDVSQLFGRGAEDPKYLQRAWTLVAVQVGCAIGPVCVVTYQILMSFERTQRWVPRSLRPQSEDERADWADGFMRSMQLGQADESELRRVLGDLDDVDFAAFRQVMSRSVATLGVLPSLDSARRRLSSIARREHIMEDLAAGRSTGLRKRQVSGEGGREHVERWLRQPGALGELAALLASQGLELPRVPLEVEEVRPADGTKVAPDAEAEEPPATVVGRPVAAAAVADDAAHDEEQLRPRDNIVGL